MAKLSTSLLPRSLQFSTTSPSCSSSSLLCAASTSSARPAISAARPSPRAQHQHQQVRHATEVARPKRPYTFTQVVQLSDGSTYTTRSTSPLPVYRSTKDTRNHLTWQPSESSLKNVEVDEAGKLASFRGRFGVQYDLGEDPAPAAAAAAGGSGSSGSSSAGVAAKKAAKAGVKDEKAEAEAAAEAERKEAEAEEKRKAEEEKKNAVDSFAELMASYVREDPNLKGGQVASNRVAKKGKKK